MARSKRRFRHGRGKIRRKTGRLGAPPPSILIVCEGETEEAYFKAFKKTFRISSVNVEILSMGKEAVTLVEKTVRKIRRMKKERKTYDQVWCVFDKDDLGRGNFTFALKTARKNGFMTAYSNEAFELWYLLHYQYVDAAVSRGQYGPKLSKLIQREYRKPAKYMFEILSENQDRAIKNAEKLLNSYPYKDPDKNNPSTTVQELVKELNKYVNARRRR